MKNALFLTFGLLCIALQNELLLKKGGRQERLRPKASEAVFEEMKVRVPRHLMQKMQKKSFPDD